MKTSSKILITAAALTLVCSAAAPLVMFRKATAQQYADYLIEQAPALKGRIVVSGDTVTITEPGFTHSDDPEADFKAGLAIGLTEDDDTDTDDDTDDE